MERLWRELPEPVVTESHVQHEFAVDPPVILRKKAKVDEAPRMVRPARVKADGARRVVHHIGKSLVRDTSCVRIGIPSGRQVQHAAEFEGMLSAQIPDML